jgi:oligopeptide transport system substrate-binding protein
MRGGLGLVLFFGLMGPLDPAHPTEDRAASSSDQVFRFHLLSEPKSLNPSQLSLTDANYLFGHLFEGLMSVGRDGQTNPRGAESCKWISSKRLDCKLSRAHRWSDGRPITAHDYKRTLDALISNRRNSTALDLLRWLKGFEQALQSNESEQWKGVEVVDSRRIRFNFDQPDPDFLHKLASPLLAPVPALDPWPKPENADQIPVSGPYRVAEWKLGRWMRLKPNSSYCCGSARRPDLEIRFGLDDAAALHLFQSGQLDLLRRLSTTLIPQYKNQPEFTQFPVARFDYIGFGPDLIDQHDLREALSHSLDFVQLQRLYDARGRPGCAGLEDGLYTKSRGCLEFDLKRARRAYARWSASPSRLALPMRLMISQLGGEDVRKGAEWLQAQWQTNLGLRVEIVQAEQGQFLETLRSKTPTIFRKGVGLESPSCAQALATFHPQGSENFLKISDARLLSALSGLQRLGTLSREASPAALRRLCDKGLEVLIQSHRLIPLGQIHFTMLASTRYKGWYVNPLNQLDLRQLEPVKSDSR